MENEDHRQYNSQGIDESLLSNNDKTVWSEDDNTNYKKAKIILSQAIPSSGAGFLTCSNQVINLYYLAGTKGTDPALIAGFGLGTFLLNAMFMSFAFGLNGALETFVSQAYGQKNLKLCSSYLHRSRVIVSMCFVLTFAILFNSESILGLLGQDKKASYLAQQYIYYNAFAVYMMALNDGTRRFLNSMSLSTIPFQINVIGIIVQILFCHYFVKWHQMGIAGIGLAMGLANILIFAGLNLYPLFIDEARDAMTWPTKDAFQNLGDYLKKGLPLSLMIFFEWLAFEFMILMCGLLSVAAQAAQTIVLNTIIPVFGTVLGIQTAMACLVGQSIGSQQISKAREYYRVGRRIALVQITTIAFVYFLTNQWILSLFTKSQEVKNIWDKAILVVSLSIMADHWQTFFQGVVRGLGVQEQLVKLILFVYWVVNLPLCYLFAFPLNLGLTGLWIGMTLSQAIIGIYIMRKIEATNWLDCSLEAKSRAEQEEMTG